MELSKIDNYNIKEFLIDTGTDEQLSKIILFFSECAKTIRNGIFSKTTGRDLASTKYNAYNEQQMALDILANQFKRIDQRRC